MNWNSGRTAAKATAVEPDMLRHAAQAMQQAMTARVSWRARSRRMHTSGTLRASWRDGRTAASAMAMISEVVRHLVQTTTAKAITARFLRQGRSPKTDTNGVGRLKWRNGRKAAKAMPAKLEVAIRPT
jgi:phage gp29-like protein